MLSLIHRLHLSLSCSTISLASQFIIWLLWQTWSVKADLWCSLVEALICGWILWNFCQRSFLLRLCVLWSWFPAVSLFHRCIPFRIGCMEFCTPLQPFFKNFFKDRYYWYYRLSVLCIRTSLKSRLLVFSWKILSSVISKTLVASVIAAVFC